MSTAFAQAALVVAAAWFDGLWQGALIAGTVWLGLRCLPRLGAATRYAVWLCALAALVLVPVLSVGLAQPPSQPLVGATVAGAPSGVSIAPAAQPRVDAARLAPEPPEVVNEPAPTPDVSHKAQIMVPRALAVAVALGWILAVCARGLLLLIDVRRLTAIRRDAWLWSAAHEYPVFCSNRVEVPLAAGFVRGAIILPASLVERLTSDDLETIVVHETAHLRRYDVWTNALARIAQALVALNPAAWFVMRRLSIEREVACDDWVVARTGAGETFARTLATLANHAGARIPIAAPSALGSRHSLVERIERLLDSRPRRLRPSPPALGGALTLLALVALTVQSLSPVLAYEPRHDVLAQASTPAPTTANCAVPNRGIRLAYLLGPERRRSGTPADDRELLDARTIMARFGTANLATFDLTVDATGKPRKVVVLSAPRYPGMADDIRRIYMASTYQPALRDCAPVEATIRTGVPVRAPEANTGSVIVPVYPSGWSDQHRSACKVPTVTHARYRSGFAPPTPYTALLPAFPDSMANVAIGSKFEASVRVQVDAAGAATSAAVVGSSGQRAFDDAVLAAARRATYPLASSRCKPLPAEYVWHTTFERTTLLKSLANATSLPITSRSKAPRARR